MRFFGHCPKIIKTQAAVILKKNNKAYYLRSEEMIESLKDIEQIVVANRGGMPIHINDVGEVRFGAPKRFGAMAIAKSAGAEVQRPLATVVIGGLLVSTFMSLIIIPLFYHTVAVLPVAKRKIARNKWINK